MLHNRYFIAFLKVLLTISLVLVSAFLIRKIIHYILPFILALATASLLQPLIRRLQRKYHFNQKYASLFITTTFFVIILSCLLLISTYLFHQIYGFFEDLPELLAGLPETVKRIRLRMESFISAMPATSQEYILEFLNSAVEKFSELPAEISTSVLSFLPKLINFAPDMFIFIGTYLIGTYFISLSFDKMISFFKKQIPPANRFKMAELKVGLKSTLLKWLKAEIILMVLTFLQLTVALTFLKVPYSALFAFVISLVDALPIFGIGTILLPWSLYCFVTGANALGVGLAASYCIMSLLRNIIEPKVVGQHIGFPPVVTLFAIYIGYKIFGFFGIILTPITLIIVKELNERGYIRLWK